MSVLQDASRVTVVGASDNGVSRVVAATKSNFAEFGNATSLDTTRFYRNVMNWVSRGLGTAARVVTDISAARTFLQGQGFTNVTLRSDWENGLGTADVLVTYLSNPSAAKQTAAASFLAAGKGIFAGYNGWALSYSGVTPVTAGGNAVLRPLGLSWTDAVAWSFDGTLVQATQTGNAQLAATVEANPARNAGPSAPRL